MARRVMDQTKAFPRKISFDKYGDLIAEAMNAANGGDGLPRVVIEDYESSEMALKAANVIRNHVRKENLPLLVSCPGKGKSVYVWKGEKRPRNAKPKKSVQPPSEPDTAPAA